jgi:hypothetical protein
LRAACACRRIGLDRHRRSALAHIGNGDEVQVALPARYWQDLPWSAFRSLPAKTVAVLPVASIEQHGPHLAVSIDTTINEGVAARTPKVIPEDLPAGTAYAMRRAIGRTPALFRHADHQRGDVAGAG